MIFIKDDFLRNPYEVRNFALKQKYTTDATYPGYRSLNVPEILKECILSEAKNILKDENIKIKSAFQYVTKNFDEGLFHRDNSKYASILFMTPSPEKNSGLDICDQCDIILTNKQADVKHNFYANTENLWNQYKFFNLKKQINNQFNPIAKIPNKFNRIIYFNSSLYHRAQNFFGNSIGNSRLTIASFFY